MATANRTRAEQADQAVLIPAVAYVRCSTDQQVDASIPAQKASIEKWAAENGYTIRRWYSDEGISGWKDDREQFQRLISDLDKRHDFQAVLCWHTNRFSRFPPLESAHYWFLLDRAGVHLATVLQGRQDWKDFGRYLLATVEQHGDAQHRFKLSADIKRGMQAVAEKGLWQHAIPYGYHLGPDRRLVLGHPAEIATVQRIFREYLAGMSLRAICFRLNSDGIPSSRKSLWMPSMLHRILRNSTYVGTYRHADIEIPGHHPAIIELETFAQVSQALQSRQRSTTPLPGGGGFLFTGLIRCAKCGGRMDGQMDKRDGHQRYACATHWNSPTCPGNGVRQDELLSVVVDTIVGWASDPAVVETFKAEVREQIGRQAPAVDPATIRTQLGTVEGRLVKAKRRLVEVDADMLPLVQEQIRALLSEQARLKDAVAAAEMPVGRVLAEADELVEESFRVFLGLRDAMTEARPELVREQIRKTVEQIKVESTRPRARAHYRLNGGQVTLRSQNLSTLEYQP